MADEKTDAPIEGEDDDALTEAEKRHMETGGETPLEEEQKAEPEPEDQEAAGDKADEKDETKDPSERVVPHGALHEERERRKEFQRRLEDQGREFSEYKGKTEERLGEIAKRLAPPAEAPPDFDEDPAAHLQHGQAETGRRLDQLEQSNEERAQQSQAAQNDQELVEAYRSAAVQFAGENPDFADAYQHWQESMKSELAAWGVTDPARVNQEVGRFERQLAAASFRDGVNPAERLYAIAKHRGYEKKAADPATPGNGEDKIAAEEKAEGAAKSLSAAGGTQATGLTMESLLAMDDDEFGQVSDKDLKKAMGG
jgi:hypothetical protein